MKWAFWNGQLSKTLAPSTVRQVYLVLAGLMKYAVRDGRLTRNPCEGIQLPRVVKKNRGYLTHGQVRKLADGCGEYGDVVLFLAYTGLRWGEMAALKVGRLDMLRRRIDADGRSALRHDADALPVRQANHGFLLGCMPKG